VIERQILGGGERQRHILAGLRRTRNAERAAKQPKAWYTGKFESAASGGPARTGQMPRNNIHRNSLLRKKPPDNGWQRRASYFK
jgi:hypothetical protein